MAKRGWDEYSSSEEDEQAKIYPTAIIESEPSEVVMVLPRKVVRRKKNMCRFLNKCPNKKTTCKHAHDPKDLLCPFRSRCRYKGSTCIFVHDPLEISCPHGTKCLQKRTTCLYAHTREELIQNH